MLIRWGQSACRIDDIAMVRPTAAGGLEVRLREPEPGGRLTIEPGLVRAFWSALSSAGAVSHFVDVQLDPPCQS